MRKLRRLPWRLPKQNHHAGTSAEDSRRSHTHHTHEAHEPYVPPEPPRRRIEDDEPTQPVAYTAGRYVYTGSVNGATDVRRARARHRPGPLR